MSARPTRAEEIERLRGAGRGRRKRFPRARRASSREKRSPMSDIGPSAWRASCRLAVTRDARGQPDAPVSTLSPESGRPRPGAAQGRPIPRRPGCDRKGAANSRGPDNRSLGPEPICRAALGRSKTFASLNKILAPRPDSIFSRSSAGKRYFIYVRNSTYRHFYCRFMPPILPLAQGWDMEISSPITT
jgi:hypothetical protein